MDSASLLRNVRETQQKYLCERQRTARCNHVPFRLPQAQGEQVWGGTIYHLCISAKDSVSPIIVVCYLFFLKLFFVHLFNHVLPVANTAKPYCMGMNLSIWVASFWHIQTYLSRRASEHQETNMILQQLDILKPLFPINLQGVFFLWIDSLGGHTKHPLRTEEITLQGYKNVS